MVCAILLALPVLTSCSAGGGTVEAGRWETLRSQTASAREASASAGWTPHDTSRLIRVPYAPKRDFQHVWIRGTFTVDGDPARFFGIIPGRIYHTDETYVNGTRVGRHDFSESANVHFPRSYELPPGVLVRGVNTVMIRVGIYGAEYGGFTNRVQVLERGAFFARKMMLTLAYQQVPHGIVVFLLGQVLFIAMLYLIRKREAEYLHSIALCLLWAVYILCSFSPVFPWSHDFRVSLLWSTAPLISINFLMLTQSYYKLYFPYINTALVPALAVIAAVILLFTDPLAPWYPARALGVGTVNFMVVFMVNLLYRIYRVKRDNLFYICIVFGVLPGVCISWDVVNYLWIYHYPPLLQTYTIPLHVILVMILIITNIMRREAELDALYGSLKERDREERKTVITSTTEEKLEHVIAFLKENFRSDIAREGLAAAMDMSVDHMSRTFRAYTGKKINEYLNELRIREAVRQLDGSEQKIIDIAFAVGFESLATFNRAFLAVMNQTPSQYKKKPK